MNPDRLAVDSQFDGGVETIEVRAMTPRKIERIIDELVRVASIKIERLDDGRYWISTAPNGKAPLWWHDVGDSLEDCLVKARAHAVRNKLIKD